MPFIDSKVTLPMTEDKKETIKAKLGQAITTLNKSEGFLMVGFDDDYTLYMGGKKLEKRCVCGSQPVWKRFTGCL